MMWPGHSESLVRQTVNPGVALVIEASGRVCPSEKRWWAGEASGEGPSVEVGRCRNRAVLGRPLRHSLEFGQQGLEETVQVEGWLGCRQAAHTQK